MSMNKEINEIIGSVDSITGRSNRTFNLLGSTLSSFAKEHLVKSTVFEKAPSSPQKFPSGKVIPNKGMPKQKPQEKNKEVPKAKTYNKKPPRAKVSSRSANLPFILAKLLETFIKNSVRTGNTGFVHANNWNLFKSHDRIFYNTGELLNLIRYSGSNNSGYQVGMLDNPILAKGLRATHLLDLQHAGSTVVSTERSRKWLLWKYKFNPGGTITMESRKWLTGLMDKWIANNSHYTDISLVRVGYVVNIVNLNPNLGGKRV